MRSWRLSSSASASASESFAPSSSFRFRCFVAVSRRRSSAAASLAAFASSASARLRAFARSFSAASSFASPPKARSFVCDAFAASTASRTRASAALVSAALARRRDEARPAWPARRRPASEADSGLRLRRRRRARHRRRPPRGAARLRGAGRGAAAQDEPPENGPRARRRREAFRRRRRRGLLRAAGDARRGARCRRGGCSTRRRDADARLVRRRWRLSFATARSPCAISRTPSDAMIEKAWKGRREGGNRQRGTVARTRGGRTRDSAAVARGATPGSGGARRRVAGPDVEPVPATGNGGGGARHPPGFGRRAWGGGRTGTPRDPGVREREHDTHPLFQVGLLEREKRVRVGRHRVRRPECRAPPPVRAATIEEQFETSARLRRSGRQRALVARRVPHAGGAKSRRRRGRAAAARRRGRADRGFSSPGPRMT